MMNRRSFIAGASTLLAAPLTVEAQQAKTPRIGVLLTVDHERTQTQLREELRRLGYVESQNILFEFRLVPAGQADRLPDLAAELVRLKVDVILAQFTPAATAAKAATTAIPIVMAPAGNPIETGLIASLARPGGNVTGVAGVASELGGKSVQLMREMMPAVRRMAALLNATDPFAKPLLEQIQLAARTVAIDIEPLKVSGGAELEAAFSQMSKARIEAVVVQPSLPTKRAAELALKHRLPTVSLPRWFAEEGGLMAYGWDAASIVHQVAMYVDRVLKGAKPADLAVEQPTKFELVINRKTAKALNLTIPNSLLLRADQIID
jgi:ABC-type uncharacterized transport system substrate-binding protein